MTPTKVETWTVAGCEFSFQGDPAKNLAALGKHGVGLRKGSEIFVTGQPRIERADYKDGKLGKDGIQGTEHSEPRRVATGFLRNKDGHVAAVTVAFTKVGKNIRMITAQPASKAEKGALRFAIRLAKNKHLLRGEIKKELGRTTERQPGKKVYKAPKKAVVNQNSKRFNTYVKKGADAAKQHADPAIQQRMRELKHQRQQEWAEKENQRKEHLRGKINKDFKDTGRSGGSKEYRNIEKDSPWKEKNREP
jgi:uncharacterized DUF497 family protein